MIPKIYFITGVCGVGKSAVIPHLKELLPKGQFDIRDFDERGVPDGAGHDWRMREVKKWLEVGTESATKNISTIICGFTKRKDFEGVSSEGLPEIEIILLNAEPEIVHKRLIGRYTKDGIFDEGQKVAGKPVNKFIEDNVWYCKFMEKECIEDGCKIVDTSKLNPEEVGREIVNMINGTCC